MAVIAPILSLGVVTISAQVLAGEVEAFIDYARVTEVTPILQPAEPPRRDDRCRDHGVGGAWEPVYPPEREADLRSERDGRIADTIGNDIRSQQQRHRRIARWQRCNRLTEQPKQGRIVGYDVRYRYGRETFLRRMRHQPQGRVPVRIELQPVY